MNEPTTPTKQYTTEAVEIKAMEIRKGDLFEHKRGKAEVTAVKVGTKNVTITYTFGIAGEHAEANTHKDGYELITVWRQVETEESKEEWIRFTVEQSIAKLTSNPTARVDTLKAKLTESLPTARAEDIADAAFNIAGAEAVADFFTATATVLERWAEKLERPLTTDEKVFLFMHMVDTRKDDLLSRGIDDGWSGRSARNPIARAKWDATRELLTGSFGGSYEISSIRYYANATGRSLVVAPELAEAKADRY